MIHYIIQVVAFQLLFLIAYDVFLKKETFFQWNRFYLIATSIGAFLLPLIKVGAIKRAIPQEYMVQLPAVLLGDFTQNQLMMQGEEIILSGETVQKTLSFLEISTVIWVIGMIVSILLFSYKLLKIWNLKRSGIAQKIEGQSVVILPETDVAFSFFSTIYIGEHISEVNKKDILLHESVHIKQMHSIDLLIFEILKILFWFNPLSYVFQKRIELLHEYIADKTVATKREDATYYQTLLSQVFQTKNVSFINSFFNKSLIKNRIIMLQKSKSNRLFQLKYLMLVPLVFGMLIYTSCTNDVSGEAYSTANFGSESDSEIIQNIDRLTESIAKNGGLTAEEERALEAFVVLTSRQGVDHPDFDNENEFLEIPFVVIEKVPTYPGCSGTNDELKACIQRSLTTFVQQNFDTKVAPSDVTGVQEIYVQFKIDSQGEVKNVKARAPHPALKEEAIRVVSSLPKMEPGKQSGKKVSVLYSLPIKFKIEE